MLAVWLVRAFQGVSSRRLFPVAGSKSGRWQGLGGGGGGGWDKQEWGHKAASLL